MRSGTRLVGHMANVRQSLFLSDVVQAVGDELLDSIVSDNIPIWTEEERYNQTVLSSVDRIEAQLTGQPVPGACSRHGPVVCQADRLVPAGLVTQQRSHTDSLLSYPDQTYGGSGLHSCWLRAQLAAVDVSW
jgi:hypothetical protein